ncbi:MAG: alginate lyase family protein [Propylenella sp.]
MNFDESWIAVAARVSILASMPKHAAVRFLLFLLWGAAASAATSPAFALRVPFSVDLPAGRVTQSDLEKCDPAPAPISALPTQSRYEPNDPTKSRVNPTRSRIYDALVKPLRDFQGGIVKRTNAFVRRPKNNADSAACALAWLKAWADADALNRLPSDQGRLNRDQALAALAFGYLQLSNVRVEVPGLRGAISTWLRRLAEDSRHYSDTQTGPATRYNNHRYFAALAVAAVALVVDDKSMFDWTMDTFEEAVCSAGELGELPLEMRRGGRSRDYQILAVGPLVMLAEIGQVNNQEPYGECNNALRRMVSFALRSIDDPSEVSRVSGHAQLELPDGELKGFRVAWLVPYLKRFPDPHWQRRAGEIGGLSATAFGGNLETLFGPVTKPPATE